MDAATRANLIERYQQGPDLIMAALDGIDAAELDARPAPGEWSSREIVHHLADAETHAFIRLRRFLAETDPTIMAFDQDAYVQRFSHRDRPIEASLALFVAVRAANAEILAQMSDADWERTGTHTEAGPFPVTLWLTLNAAHAPDHAAQIQAARAAASSDVAKSIMAPAPAPGLTVRESGEPGRQALIARYNDGPAQVDAALAGATAVELDARPGPGEWTAREIVHHLADSEANSLIRLRRLLTEEAPHIQAYDQDDYVRRFSYPGRPLAASLAVFNGVRAANAEILDQLTATDWQRAGTHPEVGPYPLTFWLEVYSAHAHDHADQIRAARASAGA